MTAPLSTPTSRRSSSGVVLVDLRRDLVELGSDVLLGDEDFGDVAGDVGRAHGTSLGGSRRRSSNRRHRSPAKHRGGPSRRFAARRTGRRGARRTATAHSVRGELDASADAAGAASGKVDGPLARPVRDQARHFEGLRPREALVELARHDVPDDAVPERRGVGRERGAPTPRCRLRRARRCLRSSRRSSRRRLRRLRAAAPRCGRAPRRSRGRARPRAPAAPSRARARARSGGRRSAGRPTARGPRPRTPRGSSSVARRGAAQQRDAVEIGRLRAMPCRLVAPAPRARPSSTVSAWSSSVWPRRIAAASGIAGGVAQRAVARVARCRLRPAGRADLDAHHAGLEPERLGLRRRGGCGIRRSVLQSVVDGDRGGAQAELRRLERRRRRQRERVGAARQRHDHRRARREAGERRAHREPHLGDGGVQSGSALIHPPTVPARCGAGTELQNSTDPANTGTRVRRTRARAARIGGVLTAS